MSESQEQVQLALLLECDIADLDQQINDLQVERLDTWRRLQRLNEQIGEAVELERRVCWQGPCYSHAAHVWTEDRPSGHTFWCPGASTDRT